MSFNSFRSQGGSRRRRERDSFSDKEAAKALGIYRPRLYKICNFFDANSKNEWKFIKGEHFEYEPGQAGKRRFYKEGIVVIAKYLEEADGRSFLAQLKGFFIHHLDRLIRARVQRCIVQATQDRSALVTRGDLLFLPEHSVVRILGTNKKGITNTIRRIEEEDTSLKGAEGLEVGVHFFDDALGRYWSPRGIVRLARTMCEKGCLTMELKAWVGAVAHEGEGCFEAQRKQLESHAARVRSAKENARCKAKACAVTKQKPNAAADNSIELEAHHLFDAATRPDLATLDENLLVITSAVHRNFHQWLGKRPCEPKDFLDYVERNKLACFKDSPSTGDRQKRRYQKLVHRLRMLQFRYEGNRLLY